MGLDSLGTTELATILQTTFGVELPLTLVFNYPTIADLTNHLHGIMLPEQNFKVNLSTQKPVTSLSALTNSDGFSIVGMSCRFPGDASSPLQFLKLLYDLERQLSQLSTTRKHRACLITIQRCTLL